MSKMKFEYLFFLPCCGLKENMFLDAPIYKVIMESSCNYPSSRSSLDSSLV